MTAPDPGRVLGRGIAFPPRVGADGRVAWSAGEENIRQAIRVVLLTEPGERLRLDEFGGGLPAMLFEPNTTAARHLLAERIRRAVTEWEPRVHVRSVEVDQDPDDRESAVATVNYELVATRTVASVAVPVTPRG